MGHWYPIMSIDFHEHAMIGMMCEVVICVGFYIFRCEESLLRDGLPRMGVPVELGR